MNLKLILIDRLVKQIYILISRKGSLLPFLLILCVSPSLFAQMNFSGKPGLLNIPTAVETKNGSLIFGYAYNPIKYSFRRNGLQSESIYYINLTVLPRLDINLNLMRMNGETRKQDKGIGDRQLDLKYLILKEKKYQPSLALYLSMPFAIDNSFTTNALVATKTFKLSTQLFAEVTAGYGSPYYLKREESEKTNSSIFNNIKLQDKNKENRYKYLSGPVGGVNLRYGTKGGFLLEWDSRHFNVGAYGKLFRKWTIQAGVINFDQVTFGTSYALNLKSLPKRLKKANENL